MVGDVASVPPVSDATAAAGNLDRSDRAHITETGQSYAEKKFVTIVVPSDMLSDVDVVTNRMQTLLPVSYPPHGRSGTRHSLR